MRVDVSIASPLEAENIKVEGGKMSFNPVFYGNAKSAGLILVVKVLDSADKVLSVNHVRVSTINGKCILNDCTKPIEPVCDKLARQSVNPVGGPPPRKA